MKKIILIALGLLGVIMTASAQPQAQKPTIMVVPAKEWCAQKGYGTRIEDGRFVPNLNIALEDQTFRDAVAGIENVFADQGYPLVNLSNALDKLSEEKAIVMVNQGRDGSGIVEDDMDIMLRAVAPDVMLQLQVDQTAKGAYNQVKYHLTVCDAATAKTWMSKSDVSKRTPDPVERLIQDAVTTFAAEMIEKIQAQFDIIREEGRETTMIINVSDTAPYNFESEVEFQGDSGELAELIEYWINENTINNSYTTGQKTVNTLKFEQCRIPIRGKAKFGGAEKAISATDFAGNLRKFLEKNLDNVTMSVHPKGLGTVYCVISSKN